jgi:hypothetical protein
MNGRLLHFRDRWTTLFPQDNWVLQVILEGLRISFIQPDPLSSYPLFTDVPSDEEKDAFLQQEIRLLIGKWAVEIVRNPQSLGFYSRLFLVQKANGQLRPIIDLSRLNQYILPPKFKMETARSIHLSIRRDEYVVSLDLADAYFHVPI